MQSTFLRGNLISAQHRSLYFKNTTTEKQFRRDVQKYQFSSLQSFLICFSCLTPLGGAYSLVLVLPALILYASVQSRQSTLTFLSLQILMACSTWFFSESGSFMELLGIRMVACLLHYFAVKRWTVYGSCLLFESCLLSSFSVPSVLSSMVCVSLYAVLEKDFRDQWLISFLYNKAFRVYFDLYSTANEAVLILDGDSKVVHLNKRASSLFQISNTGVRFTEYLPCSTTEQLLEQIRASSKGNATTEEYLLEAPELVLKLVKTEHLGFVITVQPITWFDWQYAKVTCVDNTHQILERVLSLRSLKNMHFSLNSFEQSLLRIYFQHPSKFKELVAEFLRIQYLIRGIYFLQSKMFGNVDFRTETFDPNVQCQNILDICFQQACINGLALSLGKDMGIKNLKHDKSMHNLMIFSLLELAVSESLPCSEVSLSIQAYNIVGNSVTLSYKIVFFSDVITEEKLISLLSEGSRSVRDLALLSSSHSPQVAILASVLELLGATINEASIDRYSKRVQIVLRIPLETSQRDSSEGRLRINQSAAVENSHTYRLKPVDATIYNINSPLQPAIFEDEEHQLYKPDPFQMKMSYCEDVFVNLGLNARCKPASYKIPYINIESDSCEEEIEEMSLSCIDKSDYRKRIVRQLSNRNPNRSEAVATSHLYLKSFREGSDLLTFERDTIRFLVVDDMEGQRIVLTHLLKSIVQEAVVDQASDGIQAVEMFKTYASAGFRYRIIFMDVLMISMNGDQATLKIRKIEESKNYPTTFVCGYSGNQSYREACLNAKMTDFSNFYVEVRSTPFESLKAFVLSLVH